MPEQQPIWPPHAPSRCALAERGDLPLAGHLRRPPQAIPPEHEPPTGTLSSPIGQRRPITGEAALAEVYTALARRYNDAALTDPVDPSITTFHSRPFRVLLAGRFAAACLASVTDPALRAVPLVGAIDQVCDSTDVLENPRTYRRLAGLYDNGKS